MTKEKWYKTQVIVAVTVMHQFPEKEIPQRLVTINLDMPAVLDVTILETNDLGRIEHND